MLSYKIFITNIVSLGQVLQRLMNQRKYIVFELAPSPLLLVFIEEQWGHWGHSHWTQ